MNYVSTSLLDIRSMFWEEKHADDVLLERILHLGTFLHGSLQKHCIKEHGASSAILINKNTIK